MDIDIFNIPEALTLSEKKLKELFKLVCGSLNFSAQSVSFIFVSDDELAAMHGKYLNDSSVTDVITFDLGDNEIEGEIYISIDRAKVQASEFKVSLEDEILRLMIHGTLHLAGYSDLNEPDRVLMKKEENRLLTLITGKEVN